jgi:adenylate cyclase
MASDAALDPWTLRFCDTALETGYRSSEDPKSVRIMRVGIVAAVALFALSSVIVAFAPAALRGSLGPAEVTVAFLAVAAGGAALFASTYTAPFRKHPQLSLAALCAAAAIGMASGLRFLPAEFVANRGFMFLLFHTFTIYSLLRLRLVPAVVAGWGALALYIIAVRSWHVMDDLALARQVFWLVSGNLWGTMICYQVDRALRREFAAGRERDREHARAEGLLLNILPAAIAEKLKTSHGRIAEQRDEVTVLFADLVGFTPLSALKSPAQLVEILDRVFTRFDDISAAHGLEKIKTIGDAYMAVAGLPQPWPDHAVRAAGAALDMIEAVRQVGSETGEPLQLRVGLHTGPVVAGVIGRSKFSYDLWGDTVNIASRMEAAGLPGAVHCTLATAQRVCGKIGIARRGVMDIKGKGQMETFIASRREQPVDVPS